MKPTIHIVSKRSSNGQEEAGRGIHESIVYQFHNIYESCLSASSQIHVGRDLLTDILQFPLICMLIPVEVACEAPELVAVGIPAIDIVEVPISMLKVRSERGLVMS